MTIETKFNIGDEVWLLSETKPNKGVIEYGKSSQYNHQRHSI